MKPQVFFVFATVVAVSCETVPKKDGGLNACEKKCAATYTVHTTEAVSKESHGCMTGCRFLTLTESVDKSHLDNAKSQCEQSCAKSFASDGKVAYACNLGCSYMVPHAQERREKIKEEGERKPIGFPMTIIRFPLPSFVQSIARNDPLEDGPSPFPAGGGSGIQSMFNRMNQHMNDMMSRMFKEAEEGSGAADEGQMFQRPMVMHPMAGPMHQAMQPMQNPMQRMMSEADHMMNSMLRNMEEGKPMMMDGMMRNMEEDKPMHGGKPMSGGKMVVIKSGPGYREETHYDLGGDSDRSIFERMKDMLSKMNPLDKLFDSKEVETFDPQQKPLEKKVFDVEINKQPHQPEDLQRNDRVKVDGYDYVEGPKLPESGLKTRPIVLLTEDMCRDSTHLRWSDWVSCLHMRIGMPRWLTAATISLGIIFVLWLCLVIPNNAPKQKVKKTKEQEPVPQQLTKAELIKEAEAMNVMIISSPKIDLPPSYEDVPNLRVNLEPVHEGGSLEAGAIPKKKDEEMGDSKA